MKNFNYVALEGNLTKDPELKQAGETTICKFTLAVNDIKGANFLDITSFGKLADVANKYLKKGSRVLVAGVVKQETWKNKEGENRSKIGFIANDIHFLSPKTDAPLAKDMPFDIPPEHVDDDVVPF